MNPETSSRRDRSDERIRDLFERYYGPVRSYFAELGFPLEESHDLAQDTFLRAYRGLGSFRGEANLRTWLFTIAKNVGSNAIRRLAAKKRSVLVVDFEDLDSERPPEAADAEEVNRKQGQEATVLGDGGPDPLEGLLSSERSRLLREALDSLPPRMRRSVLLHYGQGLKYREIARLLRVSTATVGSQLHQARQRLAPVLGARFSELETRPEESHLPAADPGNPSAE